MEIGQVGGSLPAAVASRLAGLAALGLLLWWWA
jgi:hypothetical protein